MNRTILIVALILSAFAFSCKDQPEKQTTAEKVERFEPAVDPNDLGTEFMEWWTYHSSNIALSQDFIGLNATSDTIGKKLFLEQLSSGDFIPLRLASNSAEETYKLVQLPPSTEESIRSTIKNESLHKLKLFELEGQPFPQFDLTDLKGNHYTSENTRGKTVVFKTWFIHCKACVAEFPELNELVADYGQQDNVIFVSLALDDQDDLKKFLQKREFDYGVVPDQESLIVGDLGLQSYPTHIVVDENGIITKVVNKASEMIAFLGRT
ncbi:TlpA family protein disulfide reductase [Flavilitoribacter nigricans]|uniref:Redoxin n=1 Tax=Flavilitoribacter nigricans (strain ATCC 23147 / DSM 23189 / NBRC 102662 / NCIMB 1420 / SS-2) TaxID=1122177 RepID=A0A2D0NAF4_FLAN2|nr:TlpA disulfide reductase family protein [Flavilitoribacter nigricans]PHN05368.1 redoxin [Flavilitoribacter nigricans DSM 23189 = NBRC 102662]